MIFGQVAGTVVATQRSDEIQGAKFLLVEACSYTGIGKKSYHVALDLVGAGPGEMVLIAQGSSCRQTERTHNKAVDAVIVGIIDEIDDGETVVFRK